MFITATGSADKYGPIHDFILRQLELLNMPKNGRLYDHQDLILAFSWYTRSRTLYDSLREVLKLPAISTLRQITRKSKNTSDIKLYSAFFDQREERERAVIAIIDEIYVKADISNSGGVLYGFAEDNEEKEATTVLCIMIKCLFGGKKFVARLVPCSNLTSGFQFEVTSSVLLTLGECGATVIAIINDNNKVNQAFFNLFEPLDPQKPWIVRSLSNPSQQMFLMYDPVHIIKNLRNNWITERTRTLCFPVIDYFASNVFQSRYACWKHLQDLYQHESMQPTKLSRLTKASIEPSNIEKQKVSLALNVFSDETCSALKFSSVSTDQTKTTALFIEQVLKLWKLLNCKSPVASKRLNDVDRQVIRDTEEGRRPINTLYNWIYVARMMYPHERARNMTLTRETSSALEWTCSCLIDLALYLLRTEEKWKHDWVALGFFQQDDIERHFGHFRMSAGCNYYLTVKDIINTHSLDRAKIFLKVQSEDLDDLHATKDAHHCPSCDLPLTGTERLLLNEIADKNMLLQSDIDHRMAMVYIAGYIAFKHKQLEGIIPQEDPMMAYFNDRNRGKLKCPSYELVNFMLIAFAFYMQSPHHRLMCRNRLSAIISKFPAIFHLQLDLPKEAIRRVANILMKRFAIQTNIEKRGAGPSQKKMAKLTSTSTSARQ